MALGQLAPWLNINTQEWGNLAARGAQLDIERQRLAEEAQERKAADALRRDQLGLATQKMQEQQQQQNAALALRQSIAQQLDQFHQGENQNRSATLDLQAQRNQDLAKSEQDRKQNAAALLAIRQQVADANASKTSFPDQENLKYLYKQLEAAQVTFDAIDSKANPDAAMKAVGNLNKIKQQIAALSKPPASAALTAGTGTNPPGTPTAIPYTKGLKPVKDQLYSIKGKTYSWDGTQFIEQ
jgi:hypothetical protein